MQQSELISWCGFFAKSLIPYDYELNKERIYCSNVKRSDYLYNIETEIETLHL